MADSSTFRACDRCRLLRIKCGANPCPPCLAEGLQCQPRSAHTTTTIEVAPPPPGSDHTAAAAPARTLAISSTISSGTSGTKVANGHTSGAVRNITTASSPEDGRRSWPSFAISHPSSSQSQRHQPFITVSSNASPPIMPCPIWPCFAHEACGSEERVTRACRL